MGRPLHPLCDEILAMLDSGLTQQQVANRLGIWARAGRGTPLGSPPETLLDRMDALHATLDAVLAETRGIGRIPNTPKGQA